ncbi:hypothetical protein F3J44_28500 [Pantoea sp. Tr-811]|uniref:hypothetical protein n=1 Tax=Pantoea sp. Tr-811 TaxID=2608361 RepID=UPI0014217FF2|nr:hypothetical protein [Pantoea sp. Tr-811]NIF30282.1 hypothetical protein [Pantoea sp. Tr-811]
MSVDLPKPEIPLLNMASRNLLLADVGDDALETYITYDGIQVGDMVYPNWRGCSAADVPFDRTLEGFQVSELDDQNRFRVEIANEFLAPLDGGWVFYSFHIDDDGEPGEQSLRQFFYVNGKEVGTLGLPVLQVQQSHELKVDLETLDGNDAQLVVLPYQAMAVGDSIVFTFEGWLMEIDPPLRIIDWSARVTLDDAEQVGRAVEFPLPNNEVAQAVGLACYVYYEVSYIDGIRPTPSAVQQLIVLSEPDGPVTLHPAPILVGLEGDIIDPPKFPNGLVVEIPRYEGLRGGDGVALLIESDKQAAQSRAILLDASSADSGRLSFILEPQWLKSHFDDKLTFSYHFGGPGVDGRSELRKVTVKDKLELAGPSVDGAIAATGEGYEWKVSGRQLINGIQTQVPENLDLPPGKEPSFIMHWDGFGKYQTDPKRTYVFPIPTSELPANLGKVVAVYYTVSLDGGDPYQSDTTRVYIEDLPTTMFPHIQAPDFSKDVSLEQVMQKGALSLSLSYWVLIGVGQLLRITVVDANNQRYVLRDDSPVTEQEFDNEEVLEQMLAADVANMPLNAQFDINVAVSFDGGKTFKPFPLVSLQLVK